ncbi:MAG: hydrogenase maturation protease [Rubrivivax sp.]|nr:hydrogenase maturation protease [Rubrivivax sp.]
MSVAPWLVLAVGNPARGDDALAPLLLERLRESGVEAGGEVELLTDFQLQVEHALDLRGRRGVLFVDAALPGAVPGAVLSTLVPDHAPTAATHALHPAAVLRVAELLDGHAPAAWLLAIEGASFGLGEPPSPAGERHLGRARSLAGAWLRARRFGPRSRCA